ncbi:MAG: metallophosphoesterase [Clostridia bacterium]|nr:metallophosphoesterase [Clostridia bacterium]
MIRPRKTKMNVCPVVCAVGSSYMICVPVSAKVLMSVFVDGEEYTNNKCGVKISSCWVQKFVIPQEKLDRAKAYTVTYEIIYREAYCSKKEKPVSESFSFNPVEKKDDIRIYHLSDVHGKKASAIKAGGYFGEALDLLILNGDISSSTQTVSESLLPLKIAFAITKGERPCIITRGNHDLRGKYAERIGEFYPLCNEKFYYTVKLGPVWFLVLDCGEDKNDDHREYAGTIAFHKYRQEETAFIHDVIRRSAEEYENDGVKYRCVVSHIPFMHTDYNPERGIHEFDIEIDTYTEWVRLLNERVRPDFGLFGHVHQVCVVTDSEKYNQKGFRAPVILGGEPGSESVEGCALTLKNNKAEIVFSDDKKNILTSETVHLSHFIPGGNCI